MFQKKQKQKQKQLKKETITIRLATLTLSPQISKENYWIKLTKNLQKKEEEEEEGEYTFFLPIIPLTQGPKWIPIWISKGKLISWFHSWIFSCISRAKYPIPLKRKKKKKKKKKKNQEFLFERKERKKGRKEEKKTICSR